MRLWTLHPRYLDARGLVALWREALLAKAVLSGRTRGYRGHPQLERFRARRDPVAAINAYLVGVLEESRRRGYRFDARKVAGRRARGAFAETRGQVAYEWMHLKRKLRARDRAKYREIARVKRPDAHPSFRIVAGSVRGWERV